MWIHHDITTPWTLQHNDIAGKMNKIVINMTKCTLKEKRILHTFWGESVTTLCYVLNRSPTMRLYIFIEEIWSWNIPFVKNLKIFDSLCHKHISYQRRKKLENKSEVMILVGYQIAWLYKLYNIVTDIIFYE